jgi:hypothetical protein
MSERLMMVGVNSSLSSERIVCTRRRCALSLCLNARLRIDLERKPAAGMAHELLNDPYILSIRNQKR